MEHYELTIVGAGLSGISAARRLIKQGRENFILVDKGKSVGGRLATRRVAEGKADHGAQFFTVRTDELEDEVKGWLDQGWVKRWFGEKYPRYTAVDGMNQLAKQLAEKTPVSLHTKVSKIVQLNDVYYLYDDAGNEWKSDKVLLTMPVPQIVELLKNSNVEVQPAALKQLKNVYFNPTYVGIFQFKSSTRLPENGHVDQGLPIGVERLVDHQKKGISKSPIVSVYMEGDWSRRHYGEDYVMTLIKENTEKFFDWDDLESEQLKRWRYAEASKTIEQSYMDLTGEGTLVAAGDAFLRPTDKAGRTRFESAFLSGKDAAAYMNW
ncbi:FAD-dependent oxidoreductase [Halobacillus yeomjeoni]|uniref:NAD(P)/FAD-dependent oxidoreductase n=1 Tax=Halobacillus yeomjeoni TaxID=311194 RepID=UPI001CD1FDFA|nr:FAD-dependent oxidoreductase [Halobacillus yeomjeoni]MCA0985348.1 FAD-dependent oxidoreductase [Halobacillus yeomjeoni]